MNKLLKEVFLIRRATDEKKPHLAFRSLKWLWVGLCCLFGVPFLMMTYEVMDFSQMGGGILFPIFIASFILEALHFFIFTELISSAKRWNNHPWRAQRYESLAGSVSEITDQLLDLPLFSYFSDALLKKIVQESELRDYAPRAHVVKEGDPSHEIFVLLSGEVRCVKHSEELGQVKISELKPPTIFGESAILHRGTRGADIVTSTGAQLLVVPTRVLAQISDENHYIRELDAFKNAIMVSQYFASSPVFQHASEEAKNLITMKSKIVNVPQGKVIFKQGDHAKDFFMVIRGSVEVVVNGHAVDIIGQGGFFGEIALISDVLRTATVITAEPCVFLRLHKEAFWEAICLNLDIALLIEDLSAQRIRQDVAILGTLPKNKDATDSDKGEAPKKKVG